jgi:8-oxo-dGTP pyrophosphatase MutT (NUDIX family)
LLRHIEACNRFDAHDFVPFSIAGEPIGHVRPATADFLAANHLARPAEGGIGISGGTFASISVDLARIVEAVAEAGLGPTLRHEMTPVLREWGRAPVAEIDRAGLPALGLAAYGVHVNGYVRNLHGLHLWVGRRSLDRQVAPGKLDHLVAGGIPMGLTASETVIKEAEEEASLPAEIARLARPVGVITYRLALPEGSRNDTLFVYDLEVPAAVTPVSNDGEVACFELWPIARVIETLRDTDDFKFNVNLVLIDFLIRHSVFDPDHEPEYAALVRGLRR